MNKKTILSLSLAGVLACGSVLGVNAATQNKVQIANTTIMAEEAKQTGDGLLFNFDENNMELVRYQGENTVMLMDKEIKNGGKSVYVSYNYIANKTAEDATKEEISKIEGYDIGMTAVKQESDLKIKSVKVLEKYEDEKVGITKYFIEDNKGGVYEVFINDSAFKFEYNENVKNALLESISLVEKDQNTNLNKIKEMQPALG